MPCFLLAYLFLSFQFSVFSFLCGLSPVLLPPVVIHRLYCSAMMLRMSAVPPVKGLLRMPLPVLSS